MFGADFQEFLEALVQHDVEFMLVGGYAYSMHVDFRYTKDLDVWVRPTHDNLERLNAASDVFVGARFDVDEVLKLLETNRLGFRLCGIEPNLIEVLLRIGGLEFDAAYANAIPVTVGNATFRVIHPHDQIRNKRAAGRPQDLVDAAMLVKRHGEPKD
jgi:hypothetical protein